MIMKGKTCSSCKTRIVNDKSSVVFSCPNCGKAEIVRCGNCRSNGIKYKCSSCEFDGPN